jgi:hypothetical protein
MSELSGQLLSVRLQNIAGEAAGHNNESAQCEITFDNSIDIEATNIALIVSTTNMCWAILDDGPGAKNIDNLWGSGEGMKVKSSDKIGNKIAGELAAGAFFEPDRLMYFSRCPESSISKHQQLNACMRQMVETVKEPGIDLTIANDIIHKGFKDENGEKNIPKLVRKPQPDTDKFDNDNVIQVKEWFKNNEMIMNYFDDPNRTGMLKVFKYESKNKDKFTKLVAELPVIIDKIEFITYNTSHVFRGDIKFQHIDIDNNTTRIVDKESCKKNFILGSRAILEEDSNEAAEQEYIESNVFGLLGEKVLYIQNSIYNHQNKKYNKCSMINFDDNDGILVGEPKIRYLGLTGSQTVKNTICSDDNLITEFPIMMSLVDKNEAEIQKKLMNETTLESLKQVYIYYQGRFIAKCKAPIAGIQERSLPNFRIILWLNETTSNLINIRAQKSTISLDTSDPIIIKTLEEIIKPILNKFSSQKNASDIIKNGIDSWNDYKNDILRDFGVPISLPTQVPIVATSLPNSNVLIATTNTTPQPTQTVNPVSNQNNGPSIQLPPQSPSQIQPNTLLNISPPTERGPAPIVLSALNKVQTIQHLKRLKTKINSGKEYRTKAEKKRLYTIVNDIERELVIDDELMSDKIDNLIEMLNLSDKSVNEKIKKAATLQDL